MMVNVLVLMYHAVPTSRDRCAGADPVYAVERLRFIDQLALIKQRGLKPRSVRDLLTAPPAPPDLPQVAVTFDDGHESNFAAFGEILRLGGSADFFINPSSVGTQGHLSWAQLREMDRQGASIQSHGMHHLSLDELSTARVEAELADSRKRIEDELGRSVVLFAPPFGRMTPDLALRARELGYQALCTSRVALWRDGHAIDIPRFAVRASTSNASIAAWMERSPWRLGAARARYLAVGAGKRLLGRSAFSKLRRTWLEERQST
jgi:peptidoglycan/xylan/chitin deacetylase (PgdA/CDA1 family)